MEKGLEMTCFFLNSLLVEAATDGHRTNHRAADEGSEPTADASLLLLWCLNWTTTQMPEPADLRRREVSSVSGFFFFFFFKQRWLEAGVYVSFYELSKKFTQLSKA